VKEDMRDCNICFSAGSVNRWGYCEVCGEDHEERVRVLWGDHSVVENGTRFQVIEGGAAQMVNDVYQTELDKITAS
jgi:hypothetical protein